VWHKAVLLISAAPITVLMNSVRIAVGGVLAQAYGPEWLEGFTHFFEGWVIFLICVVLLFLLARIMLVFHPERMGLVDALDLDTDGLAQQVGRLRLVQPSAALISAAAVTLAAALVWQALPERAVERVARESLESFPRTIGEWQQVGAPDILAPSVARTLGADEYRSVSFAHPQDAAPVGFFSAWYEDQSRGGVHSPEICLPGAGWETAWLERVDIAAQVGTDSPFQINRAVIQNGETRMMVYYWFDQKGRRIAWDFAAKMYLLVDGVITGRKDGALVRLTTPILPGESDAEAAARLDRMTVALLPVLPRFIPGG
jgi:exosortase D (VPLPA-CTERM-specific)